MNKELLWAIKRLVHYIEDGENEDRTIYKSDIDLLKEYIKEQEDHTIEEIPQFKGTLEQLNKLTNKEER